MNLKRLWDTTEKKIARVPWANWKPCQVWYGLETEKYFKQDISGLVEITDEEMNVYWPNWKLVESDDVLGYYDTNEPTDLWNPEDWDEATYTFKDYDETVLKTGKVKDWETPVAPEDPTRTGYTFTGWKPKVKPIYKDTTYTAQYEEAPAPVTRTVTFSLSNVVWDENEWEEWAFVPAESQDPLWWTISQQSVQVPDGFAFTLNGSNLIFNSPDSSSSDDDAVVVTVTVDKTMGTNIAWDLWDWLGEVSWIGMKDDRWVLTWDVSAFPIIFFDDAQ